jgi:hypothetical protein
MTYRTAGRTTKTRKTSTRTTTARKTTKTHRTAKPTRSSRVARTTKTRTPKSGQTFSVPVGRKGTMPSAWYFGR